MANLQASGQKQRIPKIFLNEILEQPDLFRAVRLVMFVHFNLNDTLSAKDGHTRTILSIGFSFNELHEYINTLLSYGVIEMTSPDIFKTVDICSKYEERELVDGFILKSDLPGGILLSSDRWESIRLTMLGILNEPMNK